MEKSISDFEKIFVVGVCRDVESTLALELEVIRSAILHENIDFFIVESDSKDATSSILKEYSEKWNQFSFVNLGSLCDRFRERTNRLAYCRNLYMDYLEAKAGENDLVVVADLDGANLDLTSKSLSHIFSRDDWHACTANQEFAYFDIWALRHHTWCPGDWILEYRSLVQNGASQRKALKQALYDKMIKISRDSEWIEVDSAFGGLGVYKFSAIRGLRYRGEDLDNPVCEHVPFHLALRKRRGRIFIVPAMINCKKSSHTEILRLSVKLKTSFWRIFKGN